MKLRSRVMHRGVPMFCVYVASRFSATTRGHLGKAVVSLSAVVLLCLAGTQQASAAEGLLGFDAQLNRLERRFDTQLDGWLAYRDDAAGAEAVDFDDSRWEQADVGYQWETPYSICWFRRWIEVPQQVGGVPAKGARLVLRLSIDNGGSIYVNGKLKQAAFDRSGGYAVLTESARPGERFLIAVRGVNRPGWGSLLDARLESSAATEILPPITALIPKLKFARKVLSGKANLDQWIAGLNAAVGAIDLASLDQGRHDEFLASIDRAEKVFQEQVVAVLRKTTESRLAAIKDRIAELSAALRSSEAAGIDTAYQRVTETVAKNFLEFGRDDLSSDDVRIVTRGMWNVDWLDNASAKAIAEAHRILEEPSRQRPVVRYATGPVEIRDGAFWQGDRPLQFVGMGHFSQVKKDIPIFPDYGFNIAQITISVGHVFKSEDEVNTEAFDELVAVLDQAAENNVAIDLLIELHGWPAWANKKYPELASETHGILKYKIDHPIAQAIIEKYLNLLIPRIADHPALFSYCLFNEPNYADESEFSHLRYQKWLAKKHGDIETLNRQHGANYSTFDQVPLPAGILDVKSRGEKPLLEVKGAVGDVTPELCDWYQFNQDRFAEVHEWVIEKVRSLDPNTPVHTKVMGKLFDTHLDPASGIDHPRWCAATDISGCDNWSYYRSWTEHDKAIAGEYACNWWRQAMYYDFQRSVEPTHPVFNSENHPIEDDTPIWVPERHVRTLYWQGAIHGQGATTTWVWERGDGQSLGDCIITRSNCAHALGTVGLDLLRLSPEVTALQQIRPEVALLIVPASIASSADHLLSVRQAYEGLHFLGAPLGFVTKPQAERGDLANYKAIVVANASRVSDGLLERIGEYVAGGGTLIFLGDSFTSDEYGRPRKRPPFLVPAAKNGFVGSEHFGDGTVHYRSADMSLESRQTFGEALMADLDVTRPIRLTDERGGIVSGVEYRSVPYRDGYLLNLVNYNRQEVPVRILAPLRIEQVTNLFDDEPADAFLELEPLEPHLLYLRH